MRTVTEEDVKGLERITFKALPGGVFQCVQLPWATQLNRRQMQDLRDLHERARRSVEDRGKPKPQTRIPKVHAELTSSTYILCPFCRQGDLPLWPGEATCQKCGKISEVVIPIPPRKRREHLDGGDRDRIRW